MPALHDSIMQIMQAMGGVRALNHMRHIGDQLKHLHNQEGSKVREEEKGCWDGALAAWKREGMPKRSEQGHAATEQGKVIMMMLIEQYSFGALQHIAGTAQDAGRSVFSEEDFGLLERMNLRYSGFDAELLGELEEQAAQAAEFV
jgi:hypothetical protein